MKKIISLLTVALLLSACAPSASGSRVATERNTDDTILKPVFLFESEGCKVYRFTDAGRYVYYVNCGNSSSATSSYDENCGKSCTTTVDVGVTTKYE